MYVFALLLIQVKTNNIHYGYSDSNGIYFVQDYRETLVTKYEVLGEES